MQSNKTNIDLSISDFDVMVTGAEVKQMMETIKQQTQLIKALQSELQQFKETNQENEQAQKNLNASQIRKEIESIKQKYQQREQENKVNINLIKTKEQDLQKELEKVKQQLEQQQEKQLFQSNLVVQSQIYLQIDQLFEQQCDIYRNEIANMKNEVQNYELLFENLDSDTFLGQIISKVEKKVLEQKNQNADLNEQLLKRDLLAEQIQSMLKIIKDIVYGYQIKFNFQIEKLEKNE